LTTPIPSGQGLNTVNVINHDTIIITSNNRLIKSSDGGENWQILNINIPNIGIKKSYFSNSQIGHAVCGNGIIIKTIDGGENWYITENSRANIIPSHFITLYFVNDKIGFASQEYHYLFKTTDGGETWKQINSPGEAIYAMFFINEHIGYAIGDYGVPFKTYTGGQLWEELGTNVRRDAYSLFGLYFTDALTGFAVGLRGRILKTKNGGQTWKEYGFTYETIIDIQSVSDSIVYAIAGNNVIKSNNAGKNWAIVNMPSEEQFYNINFFSRDTGIITGKGKIFKTYNGGISWITIRPDSYDQFYRAISFLNQDTGFLSGNYYGLDRIVAKTNDGGQNWEIITRGEHSFDQLHFINSNTGFGLLNGDLYRTINGGKNWELIYEIYGNINDMHFVNDSIGYLVGDYATLLKTTDGGTIWQETQISSENTYPGHLYGVAFYNAYVGFASSEGGLINKTMDGGITWERIQVFVGISNIEIPKNRNIYFTGNSGIILSSQMLLEDVFRVQNLPVAAVTDSSSLLSVKINASAEIKDISFEFGKTNEYGTTVAATPYTLQGLSDTIVKAELTNLEPGTTYHYRLKAYLDSEEYIGEDQVFMTTGTTDVNNITKISDIILFPNPAKDILLIKGLDSAKITNFEIINLAGQSLLKDKYKNSNINIASYPSGTYFLKLEIEHKTYVYQFVKE